MADAAPRAPRADARINREHLLDVAETYFAEHGLDASLHELVKRAHLGIGTLYRHFPTHDDLVKALYDRLVARLEDVLSRMNKCVSGWDKIVAYIDGTLAIMESYPVSRAVMARMRTSSAGYRPGARFEVPMRSAVTQAHVEGSLRADVTGTDVAFLPYLLGSPSWGQDPAALTVKARQRAIMLDGVRAAGAVDPLPQSPNSVDQLHEIVHTRPRP